MVSIKYRKDWKMQEILEILQDTVIDSVKLIPFYL